MGANAGPRYESESSSESYSGSEVPEAGSDIKRQAVRPAARTAWGVSTESLDSVLFRAPSTTALGSVLGPSFGRRGDQPPLAQAARPIPRVRDTLPRHIAGWDRVPRGVSGVVPAASSSGDLVAFMCQFAFFIVPADDPRVPLLRVRAALDTELSAQGSRGIRGWQRLVEYGVDGDSVKHARGSHQAVVALLACLQAVLVAVLIATLPLAYSINVAEWCTRPSTDVAPLAHSSIDAVVLTLRVMCVALAIAMASFAIVVTRSMFGVRATEFVWRYATLTWLTYKLHAFACVLAACVALVQHEWILLSVAVGALGALPLFDLAAMLTSRRWASRLYTTALMFLIIEEYVRFELNNRACSDTATSLGSMVYHRLITVVRLTFAFGMASALLRKVRLPMEPLVTDPWRPFLTAIPAKGVVPATAPSSDQLYPSPRDGDNIDSNNNGPDSGEPLFDVFYGPHETRVVAVGSPGHSAVQSQMRVAGSWRVTADRSFAIDTVFIAVIYVYITLIIMSTGLDIGVMVHDADTDRGCFEVSRGTSVVSRASFVAWMSLNVVVLAGGAPFLVAMIAKSLRSRWTTVVRYVAWLASRHPAFACTTLVSTVTLAAMRFDSGWPPSFFAVGLCLPVFDFPLITIPPRSALWWAARAAMLTSWASSAMGIVLVSVRVPLICSAQVDDATITDNVLFVVFSAAASIWIFQASLMYMHKVRDPSTPFIPFTIEPKRAYDNLWFDVAKSRNL